MKGKHPINMILMSVDRVLKMHPEDPNKIIKIFATLNRVRRVGQYTNLQKFVYSTGTVVGKAYRFLF